MKPKAPKESWGSPIQEFENLMGLFNYRLQPCWGARFSPENDA